MNTIKHFLILLLFCSNSPILFAQEIDVELSIESSNPVFPIFTASDFTLNLVNTIDTDVTGIVVSFPVLEQGVTRVAGTEEIVTHGTYDIFKGEWVIDNLPAGERASINIRLFAREDGVSLFAQVVKADQEDLDSSPNNGQCCDAMEDDEAVFSTLDYLHKFVYCPEDIRITVPRGAAGAIVHYPDAIFESDCETPFTFEQVLPEGLASGSFFPVGFTGALYRANNELCGERLCAFNIIVQERDAVVDLELTATSDTPVVGRYESAQYTINISNNSDTDATGVKVQLDIPDNVKQVGNFQAITSAGRYIPFFRLWEIGTLPAGASESLEVAIFTLEEGARALAQVVSVDQADADSFPSSAECCEANEDDEVVLNAVPTAPNIPMIAPEAKQNNYLLFPNPAQDALHITFFSEANHSSWRIFDMQGKHMAGANWTNTEGYQERTLDVSMLESGLYYLHIQNGNSLETLRFLVL